MSKSKITELTPEQEALIPVYVEKWRKIAIYTEPIDREKAAEAIDAAYAAIGLYKPRLMFYDSPYEGFGKLDSRLQNLSKKGVKTLLHKQYMEEMSRRSPLIRQLWIVLKGQIEKQVGRELYRLLERELRYEVSKNLFQIERQLYNQMESQLYSREYLYTSEQINRSEMNISTERTPLEEVLKLSITPETLAGSICFYDFCISVLNCTCDRAKWEALQLIVKDCGWFTPFKNIAILCDRPIKLSLDDRNLLHAEGEPAIEYADGYNLYSYRGVTLPEKYGKLYPHQWQTEWLLEEEENEIRRALIQGIGYARICERWPATEIDNWLEYTILNVKINYQKIDLLRKTSPSTGKIEFLELPHDFKSAREAVASISILNFLCEQKQEGAFRQLLSHWRWWDFEKTDIVWERPIKVSFDNQNRLHAEGEAAIEFADGYSLYFYRGVMLPEKYGKLHPHQWQAQWLLQEGNVEVRRVLMPGIGYAKMCQELRVNEIDSWQEYTLLKLHHYFEYDGIFLLKMTCPSTGQIYALRVPPKMRSAREAIRWVNWGIDPEEFAVQT
ncbi:hypothetical protein H6S82_29490 [Planktothrix sp. FACHB-1355]|uniref:DUF6745 domain-containing protein n=1 Tax=Aerosakkonema funiforme FACHB-1375 TaxID=2949571 RepID=A0A926VM71_9CYAN|nr:MULTISPECIES: hypothetical protein [Oscillatoriales]MBD2186304.1 hypothetical protein [Aerosakkonema funiforme FACHB-1375]MBD3562945.1 hypothetical protein [Planktothrix sp. FACHB-1355]